MGRGGPRPPRRSTGLFQAAREEAAVSCRLDFCRAGRATAARRPRGNGPRIRQQSHGLREAGAAGGEPASSLTFVLPGLPKAGDEAGPAGLESLAVHGEAGWANLSWRET